MSNRRTIIENEILSIVGAFQPVNGRDIRKELQKKRDSGLLPKPRRFLIPILGKIFERAVQEKRTDGMRALFYVMGDKSYIHEAHFYPADLERRGFLTSEMKRVVIKYDDGRESQLDAPHYSRTGKRKPQQDETPTRLEKLASLLIPGLGT